MTIFYVPPNSKLPRMVAWTEEEAAMTAEDIPHANYFFAELGPVDL